ncbi:MAG TPA: epoxyqueuosine reductase [Thermodesulfobacteriota bacterium]|nr:epoxyqueuosine reductase [Thermodesulfobacteriota bacterium]
MTVKGIKDPAEWLETTIKDFINESPENTLQNEENERAWADPLVGYSRGDDPLYQEYKEKIGAFHWTPTEIFNETFPGLKVEPDHLMVISWVLPHVQATKSDNRMQSVYPSERWARARIYGEEVNAKLRGHVVTTLQGSGFEAVAPMLSPQWARKTSERYGFASTWSERHAAYASGLGTFGLCDGLITPKGKAVRVGSVVARIRIPSAPRPYNDHHAYCLFFTQGICGKCISRCPVGAITEAGHEKVKCQKHLRPTTAEYVKSHYGFDGHGCGLCQTKVPCESKIPSKQDVEMYESL